MPTRKSARSTRKAVHKGAVRNAPYVFTEHGAIMASFIIKTIRGLMNPPVTPRRSIGFVERQERK